MHESYARLETALTDFIDKDESGAFLLRGEWGVGKTYACLQCLKAKNEKAPGSFFVCQPVWHFNNR